MTGLSAARNLNISPQLPSLPPAGGSGEASAGASAASDIASSRFHNVRPIARLSPCRRLATDIYDLALSVQVDREQCVTEPVAHRIIKAAATSDHALLLKPLDIRCRHPQQFGQQPF